MSASTTVYVESINEIIKDELKKTKPYYVEVLDMSNEALVEETAKVIADTFVGVQVGERYVKEPMISTAQFTHKAFYEFTLEYVKDTGSAGLNVIARDIYTHEVIGALISENFDPYIEIPTFHEDMAPLNELYAFLVELDEPFVEKAETKLGRKIEFGDYVHLFLMGIKAERKKRFIAADLIDLLKKISCEKGYMGIFAEATSYRSQSVFKDLAGFYQPVSLDGTPVSKQYAGFAPYHTIPVEVSPECQILYYPLGSENEL